MRVWLFVVLLVVYGCTTQVELPAQQAQEPDAPVITEPIEEEQLRPIDTDFLESFLFDNLNSFRFVNDESLLAFDEKASAAAREQLQSSTARNQITAQKALANQERYYVTTSNIFANAEREDIDQRIASALWDDLTSLSSDHLLASASHMGVAVVCDEDCSANVILLQNQVRSEGMFEGDRCSLVDLYPEQRAFDFTTAITINMSTNRFVDVHVVSDARDFTNCGRTYTSEITRFTDQTDFLQTLHLNRNAALLIETDKDALYEYTITYD